MKQLVPILLAISTVSSFAGSVDLTGDWKCSYEGVNEESLIKAHGDLKSATAKGDGIHVSLNHQGNMVVGSYKNPLDHSKTAMNSETGKILDKDVKTLCSVLDDPNEKGAYLDCASTQYHSVWKAKIVNSNHIKGSYVRHADKTGVAKEVASVVSFDCKR